MSSHPKIALRYRALTKHSKKIVVELYSYSFEQLYNFWSVVGAKYLPSVLYKVKTLTIQENAIQESGEPIEQIFLTSLHKS
ncbi:Pvc16 family protein [Algoriphagus boritolerans]|uniref:Pvc16 family protein n=1 Tax=Algoriphagus boritolerans TaxID=308111 RepID=UPI003A0FF036